MSVGVEDYLATYVVFYDGPMKPSTLRESWNKAVVSPDTSSVPFVTGTVISQTNHDQRGRVKLVICDSDAKQTTSANTVAVQLSIPNAMIASTLAAIGPGKLVRLYNCTVIKEDSFFRNVYPSHVQDRFALMGTLAEPTLNVNADKPWPTEFAQHIANVKKWVAEKPKEVRALAANFNAALSVPKAVTYPLVSAFVQAVKRRPEFRTVSLYAVLNNNERGSVFLRVTEVQETEATWTLTVSDLSAKDALFTVRRQKPSTSNTTTPVKSANPPHPCDDHISNWGILHLADGDFVLCYNPKKESPSAISCSFVNIQRAEHIDEDLAKDMFNQSKLSPNHVAPIVQAKPATLAEIPSSPPGEYLVRCMPAAIMNTHHFKNDRLEYVTVKQFRFASLDKTEVLDLYTPRKALMDILGLHFTNFSQEGVEFCEKAADPKFCLDHLTRALEQPGTLTVVIADSQNGAKTRQIQAHAFKRDK